MHLEKKLGKFSGNIIISFKLAKKNSYYFKFTGTIGIK